MVVRHPSQKVCKEVLEGCLAVVLGVGDGRSESPTGAGLSPEPAVLSAGRNGLCGPQRHPWRPGYELSAEADILTVLSQTAATSDTWTLAAWIVTKDFSVDFI